MRTRNRCKLPKHTVISFPRNTEDEDLNPAFVDYPYLKNHNAWAVVRVDHPSYGEDNCVRLRSMDGRVAMTKWLCLYDSEYVVDPFLTAVHKAQRRAK